MQIRRRACLGAVAVAEDNGAAAVERQRMDGFPALGVFTDVFEAHIRLRVTGRPHHARSGAHALFSL